MWRTLFFVGLSFPVANVFVVVAQAQQYGREQVKYCDGENTVRFVYTIWVDEWIVRNLTKRIGRCGT